MNKELKIFLYLVAAFAIFYFLPVGSGRFDGAVLESLKLVKWYAREHVILCLVPAFFIAGAIGVFISQNAVMKYFGPKANKALSYGVASVSGTILAVCSCTVLPLFGGIYLRGAGLGPAIAFLYSGPAINVLAIVLTARILGFELGLWRALGAIVFSIVIGAIMHLLFLKEERKRTEDAQVDNIYMGDEEKNARPLWQTASYFLAMSAILVFANWGKPLDSSGIWFTVFKFKWTLTSLSGIVFAAMLWKFFKVKASYVIASVAIVAAVSLVFPENPVMAFAAGAACLVMITFGSSEEMKNWREQTWGFAKQITPLLLGGVLAAGFFLGSPETPDAGIVPGKWIQALVGKSPDVFYQWVSGTSGLSPDWLTFVWPVWTNFFSSLVGAFMYFATLTEVPILRGLIDSGMGQGPALALLLAGPALSLPSMLVINSIIGPKKTAVYVGLVVIMSTITGLIYGIVM
ncbi:MAG TPA: hypothetical protein DET40_15050 [Lentisphaeria bacterium]|nr:MAG: permease [Lentisphaerae bacterium GWF2_50_93]HCE44856.1 hypothetical protein [Lentisphaeria bacterium]